MKFPWSRTSRTAPKTDARRRASLRSRPTIELMEGRQLLTAVSIPVTNISDNGDNSNPIAGSFRAAVILANQLTGSSKTAEIDFHIAGGGYQTISLSSPLPTITESTFINGASESGYAGTPLIQLDGSYAGGGVVGLTFNSQASGSRVSGLEVGDFNGGGILLSGASNVMLDNDWVGAYTLTRSGTPLYTTTHGNGTYGVELAYGADYNTLTNDVVSANQYNGVVVMAGSNGNTISNSKIGTDPTGNYATSLPGVSFGNGQVGGGGSGVVINGGSSNNTLANDVISDNHDYGVFITDYGTSGNTLYGDRIGTDVTGTQSFGNHYGVTLANGSLTTRLGVIGQAVNVISGNAWDGVQLLGGTFSDEVTNDDIGTNASGTGALPNGGSGVAIAQGAYSNNVDHDLISGNVHYGVYVSDHGTLGNDIHNNLIGTNANGNGPLGNNWGLWIQGGATSNTVDSNVISGNTWTGIELTGSGTSYNTVSNNRIGTDSTGNVRLANAGAGVALSAGSSGNTVVSNVVSGNSYAGVWINASSNNTVASNKIGLNAAGNLALSNPYGVELLNGSTGNTIGGSSASGRNFLSGNANAGVLVSDPGTSGNTVEYDFIGTDVSGELPVSNNIGVVIQNGASYTYVYNDLISANTFAGVDVTGGNTNNNFLTGDWIGLDVSGSHAVKQAGQQFSNSTGVVINGAYNTSVGSDFISGNQTGVVLNGGASSNWIVYDHVGTGTDGTTNVGNTQDGVILDGVSNNLVGYDTLVYNGDVGVLGEDGSDFNNNSLVSPTFTITVNGITYGNRNGATDTD
jgi:parallel beta-helix repeat protein